MSNLKQNNKAKAGDLIYLTKKLGVGILTTAEKKGILKTEHKGIACEQMIELNKFGEQAGKLSGVTAMTDVTGFGLLGHLLEVAEASGLTAVIDYSKISLIDDLKFYTSQFCFPDNTFRNWSSYEPKVSGISGDSLMTLCDPQTNGGLLITLSPDFRQEFEQALIKAGLKAFSEPIGVMKGKEEKAVEID